MDGQAGNTIMRISTKSWHYRLLDFYDFDIPNNLCPYFWKVVGTLLATPIIIIAMLVASLFDRPKAEQDYNPEKKRRVGIWLYVFTVTWTAGFGVYDIITQQWIFAGIMFGILAWMILRPILKFHFHYERKPKEKKPKEPNIAWEYLKAKKHRYCPVITFYNPQMEDESWKKGLE